MSVSRIDVEKSAYHHLSQHEIGSDNPSSRQFYSEGVGFAATMLLRGILKVTAAATGLLLIYSITYAMEGMTTRLPAIPLHELARSTLWVLPWMLLFCSGAEDIGKATRTSWAVWAGFAAGMGLLFYLEHFTADTLLTKVVFPLAVALGGLLPHFVRSIRFVYIVCSLAVGIAGLVVFYFEGSALLSGSSFATRTIGCLVVTFGISSVAAAALSATSLQVSKSK
jgi:hypothetical protein